MSTQAITSYVRAKMPNHMFNTVSIYCNTGTDPHKDNRNAPVSNGIVALSDFKGGEVWIESEDGESIQVVGGKQMRGTLVPITDEPAFIEAHSHLHFTMPWKGRRVVLIAFSVAGLEELTPQDYDSLISHGFSVKAPSEASEAMCADTSCMEEEATAPAGDSEPFTSPLIPMHASTKASRLSLSGTARMRTLLMALAFAPLLGGSLRLGVSVLAIGP